MFIRCIKLPRKYREKKLRSSSKKLVKMFFFFCVNSLQRITNFRIFRENKLLQIECFRIFRGVQLSRFWQRIANLRKFLPLKYSIFKLTFAYSCHFTTLGNRNHRCNFACDDIIIKKSFSEKILRLTIDNNLDFSDHISNICKTVN